MQENVRILGMSNLYWESYSGKFVVEKKTTPLQGLVRFCFHILPYALVSFPTIGIYTWIIRVRCQKYSEQLKGPYPPKLSQSMLYNFGYWSLWHRSFLVAERLNIWSCLFFCLSVRLCVCLSVRLSTVLSQIFVPDFRKQSTKPLLRPG